MRKTRPANNDRFIRQLRMSETDLQELKELNQKSAEYFKKVIKKREAFKNTN